MTAPIVLIRILAMLVLVVALSSIRFVARSERTMLTSARASRVPRFGRTFEGAPELRRQSSA
jgi:hypothetical protein